MKKIDFHTHVFPDKLAEKALKLLSDGGGGLPWYVNGTVEDLKKSMAESGIAASVLMNIATNPRQQKAVNDFAAAVHGGNIISFGSVHPDSPDALCELDRIHDMGLPGIKFHLDCQDFHFDHPALKKIYEKIVKLGLMVCFHTGWDMSTAYCRMTPENMLKTLPMLEGTVVIAAHFGAYAMWDRSFELLCGKDVYFDTAVSCGKIPLKLAASMIEAHGADKVLFGSDSPWSKQTDEAYFVELLPISDDKKELIFYKNAERLLKRR